MIYKGVTIQLLSSQPEREVTSPEGIPELEQTLFTPKPLRRGDIATGVVVAANRDGLWVSFGCKFEGVVPPAEFRSSNGDIKVGDEILVYVLDSGKAEGGMLLSFDRARRYLGWQKLEHWYQDGGTVTAEVVSFNRGGLVVRWEDIEGFIPLSEVVGRRLREKVGLRLEVKILEVNPRNQRLIFSERLAFLEAKEREKARAISQLVEGERRWGKVTGIQSFGVFIDVGGIEGLCPLFELSWERGKAPQEVVNKGQEVEVVVVRIDAEAKKVLLSLKRATPHPWQTVTEKYKVGQMVFGTVTRLFPFGALARVDGAIEGLIHISELATRRVSHPKEVVREGQVLPLKVLGIDPQKRHMRLSLRQAQEEEYPTPEQGQNG